MILDAIIILLIIIGLFFYLKKRKNPKKKKKNFVLGCLIPAIVIVAVLATVGIVAYNGYKEAEIKYGIKKAQETYLKNINKYKNFSNKEAKELIVSARNKHNSNLLLKQSEHFILNKNEKATSIRVSSFVNLWL